jgi:hypothetical protein
MRALADHQSNFPTEFGISHRRTTPNVVIVCLWTAFGIALTALLSVLGFGVDFAGVLAWLSKAPKM